MIKGSRTFEVTISTTQPLSAFWHVKLSRVVVEDGGGLPAAATISFRDADRFFFDTSKNRATVEIGTPLTITIKISSESSSVKLFTGEIVALQAEGDASGTFSTIRAFDLSHRLMRGSRAVTHRDNFASGFARDVATKAGLPIGTIDPTTQRLDTRDQVNVSDWEFLQSLARDFDREAVVENGRFHFRKPTLASTAPTPGTASERLPNVIEKNDNLLWMRASVTAVDQTETVSVNGWDDSTKKDLAKQVKAASSTAQRPSVTPAMAVKKFAASDLVVTDVPLRTMAEVTAVANAVSADVMSSYVDVKLGVRGTPQLRSGMAISLYKVGPPFDGKYTISSCRHTIVPRDFYETVVTCNSGDDRSTYGLASGASAPARPTRMTGVTTGIVTNVRAGKEPGSKHPEYENLPLVKLRFPYLTEAKGYESDWAPTVQMGGADGGGVFCPEVGDAVIVDFEHGLLDRPIVLGGRYNGKDRPTMMPGDPPLIDPVTGQVNRRSIASRRGRKGGNRIELLDQRAGLSGIRLRTDGDQITMHLDDRQMVLTVHSDGTIEIDATKTIMIKGNGITLDAQQGELTLKGRSVSMEAKPGDVRVRGTFVRIN